MKTIFALPLLILGLAACQTYPGDSNYPGQGSAGYPDPGPYPQPYPPQPYPPQPYPGQQGNYRAIGTEPFWDLTIGRDMIFTDRGTNLTVTERTPPVRNGYAGEIYQGRRINVNIVHSRCSDGMSDRTYPDQVQVRVDGRDYRGCGGAASFFAAPNEGAYQSTPQGVFNLSNTNWRVVSINGQPVPRSGFYLNFMASRMSGKFGCNSLNGSYRVNGSTLTASALAMTKLACPSGSFEAQGVAIVGQPVTLIESGDRLTLSNRLGAIELTRAR
ncbi:MAG: META domain-containing protein [Sphingomonas sp.]|uniref:META domain-containing protein n=1 Tax=Sphingomonas sp. TaxID=28214 RepID=UPI0018115DCE|nr:META domain-containing protein [Sphingomonas sp.]MBA3666102.1 META domain-containing protein [Sphingomonas sp.]